MDLNCSNKRESYPTHGVIQGKCEVFSLHRRPPPSTMNGTTQSFRFKSNADHGITTAYTHPLRFYRNGDDTRRQRLLDDLDSDEIDHKESTSFRNLNNSPQMFGCITKIGEDSFKQYGCNRATHPFYRTSGSQYGFLPPMNGMPARPQKDPKGRKVTFLDSVSTSIPSNRNRSLNIK